MRLSSAPGYGLIADECCYASNFQDKNLKELDLCDMSLFLRDWGLLKRLATAQNQVFTCLDQSQRRICPYFVASSKTFALPNMRHLASAFH